MAHADVPLIDPATGRFPDEFAPPSVAADAAVAEAARVAAVEAAEGVPGAVADAVTTLVDPKVQTVDQARTEAVAAASTAVQSAGAAVEAAARAEAVPAQVDTAMAAQVGAGGEFDTKLNVTIGEKVQPAAEAVATQVVEEKAAPRDMEGIGRVMFLRDMSQRSKGGTIGVGNRPTISFRIDHGAQQWLQTYWPMFKSAGIPCSLGVVTDSFELGAAAPYEPTTYTWADLKAEHRRGFEVWSHTRSHLAPFPERPDGYTIYEETVGSKRILEEQGFWVTGFQGAGVPGLTTPDYSNNFNQDTSWSSEHAHLLLTNYALMTPGQKIGGAVRALPMGGSIYSSGRYTLDDMTRAAAEALIDGDVVKGGLSIEFMIHPRLASANWITDLPLLLSKVRALWDAGTVEVLTVSGQTYADPTHKRRLDIVRNGSWEWSTVYSVAESGWGKAGGTGTFEIRTDGGHSGPNYLRIPAEAGYTYASQSCTQVGHLSLVGTTMIFEAWARAVDSDTQARVFVQDTNDTASLNIEHWQNVPNDGKWHRICVPFSVPLATSNLSWRLNRRGGGGVDWDDIRVMPV